MPLLFSITEKHRLFSKAEEHCAQEALLQSMFRFPRLTTS